MAMKTKKERFHVGALNQDLKGGNEQRERESRGGEGGGHCTNAQAIRRETKCRGGHVGKNLKSSLTVLESNSCLFCAKTFSTPAWSVYVTNPNPLRRNKPGGEKEASLRMNKICLKTTLLVKHGVTGRCSEHASFLPRPFGNGIPHHHALLHLAEFTKVLLQALCKDGGGGYG